MTKGKLLLTSAGITNDSIQKALVDLLGKPISESSALFVPTAIYAYPQGIKYGWQVIKGLGELGWKALGVLELTALSSLPKEIWLPQVEEVDAIIVGVGLVDFVIRPHLNADYFPQAALESVEKWAAKVDYPLYALDDQSALIVIDGKVEVISLGEWKLFGKP